MLHLSSFTITLGKSNDYLRVVCLIHVFGLVVLFNSALPWPIMMGMLLVLITSGVHQVVSKVPVPAFSKLSYHTHYWLLHPLQGVGVRYEQMRIAFDGGLFLLLTLTNEGSHKKIVIFNDQLTDDQRRALHVIGKIK